MQGHSPLPMKFKTREEERAKERTLVGISMNERIDK
jgi:hypothetical protein